MMMGWLVLPEKYEHNNNNNDNKYCRYLPRRNDGKGQYIRQVNVNVVGIFLLVFYLLQTAVDITYFYSCDKTNKKTN